MYGGEFDRFCFGFPPTVELPEACAASFISTVQKKVTLDSSCFSQCGHTSCPCPPGEVCASDEVCADGMFHVCSISSYPIQTKSFVED